MSRGLPLNDFSEDKLQREKFADYLSIFIKTSYSSVNTNSLVIALDSPWGTGKTSFINMWSNKLKNHDSEGISKYNIINYNAWENDDCSEAIIPIICSFSQLLKDERDDDKKEKIINAVKIASSHLLGAASLFLLNVDVVDKFKSCKSEISKISGNEIYEEYKSLQSKKDTFSELVSQFASKETPLLIFIDELDRCRPTFAIETLEAVKHFFDLPNVIFIFSLDIDQLSKSVKTIYGDINSEGYLMRFFDYKIKLPKSYYLDDLLSERLIFNGHGFDYEIEINHLSVLKEKLSLSLRDLNVICEAYINFIKQKKFVYEAILDNTRYRKIYLTLIALKYKDTVRYLDIVQNGIEITDQNNKFLIDIIGHRDSTLDDYYSLYTKDVAEMSLIKIYNSDLNTKERLVAEMLLSEDDYNYTYRFPIKITLSEAILNNIEYGSMFIG